MKKTMLWMFLLVSAPAFAAAQEKPKDSAPEPIRITPPSGGEGDPHEEMERLIGEIERKMRRVNRLLEEASSGRPRAAGAKGEIESTIKAIDELLRQSEESSRSTIKDIDRLLELSEHEHSGGTWKGSKSGGLWKSSGKSGGSSGDKQSQAKNGSKSGKQPGSEGQAPSPLDRQGTATTERESAPQTPEMSGGEKPQGQKPGEKPGGGKQGQSNQKEGDPRGNQATDGEGENVAGNAPPKLPTEATSVQASSQDRWGDLPEHARDLFRMQGGGDMPPRYREWIDAYYKRLNKKP